MKCEMAENGIVSWRLFSRWQWFALRERAVTILLVQSIKRQYMEQETARRSSVSNKRIALEIAFNLDSYLFQPTIPMDEN